jgi:hypothetical protein
MGPAIGLAHAEATLATAQADAVRPFAVSTIINRAGTTFGLGEMFVAGPTPVATPALIGNLPIPSITLRDGDRSQLGSGSTPGFDGGERPTIRLGALLADTPLAPSNEVQSESTDVIVSKNPDGGVKKQNSADLGLDEELLERLKIRLPKGSNSSRQAGAATH